MTGPPPPKTIEEYRDWAATNLGVDFDASAIRNRYEVNLQNAQNAIQKSQFIQDLPSALSRCEEDCQTETGAGLLLAADLQILRKPFESSVVKSFRRNVLNNRRFPNEPRDGWVGPDSWYGAFDDLLRATLVCRFLDGPKKLAESLNAHAVGNGLSGRHTSRGTDDGYYAYHQYTRFPVEIVTSGWDTQEVEIELEIQLTTQLQEVLRDLTHPLYEKMRLSKFDRNDEWKWDYDTPRFRTSYLGHTLHMIEAVIVQVRNLTTKTTAMDTSNPSLPAEGTAVAEESTPEGQQ